MASSAKLTKLPGLIAKAKREGWYHEIRTASDEQALLEGCYFDQRQADRVCDFFTKFLRHSKGAHAGKPFELLDWQRERLINPVFGWMRPTGFRRFTRVYCELPKKNGKSTIAAGIGLYMMVGDREAGAHIFSAATDKKQAMIVHSEAINMVERSPALMKAIKINRSTNLLRHRRSSSEYSALSAAPNGKEGFDGHCAVIDELHVWPGRQLWDALRYMGRARRQPIIFVITTAGDDLQSVCYEQHQYAENVLSGKIIDTRFYPLVYGCTAAELEGDKIFDRKLWRKANPSMGHTMDEDEFGRDLKEAMQSPRSRNAFLRYSFNVWAQSVTAWLDHDDWSKAAIKPDLRHQWPEDGATCYGGLDLAKTSDMSSFVLVFGTDRENQARSYELRPTFWLPRAKVIELSDRLEVKQWEEQGFLNVTEGDVVDYESIKSEIARLNQKYRIEKVAFDPWNAEALTQWLETELGINRVEFRQSIANFTHPTSEFERLLKAGLLSHPDHPILSWQARHVSVKTDVSGNYRPVKPEHGDIRKIDGIVASIMGLSEAMLAAPPSTGNLLIF